MKPVSVPEQKNMEAAEAAVVGATLPTPTTSTMPVAPYGREAPSFAVVVPAYNEVENMPDLVRELRATFEKHALTNGEVVLVDDGSSDGTADAALREAGGWSAFRVVRHKRNFGKTEAMVTAAETTDADVLVVFDADLQHSTEEIPRFLAKIAEGWDIVTGRKQGFYEKRAVSSTYNWLSRRMFNVPVSDLNSMKAFRRGILDEIRLRHDWHRFFVVLAHARGHSVTEIDIPLHPRRHGVAKYSGRGRMMVGLLDLFSVGFFLFFARKPLMLFGVSGIVMAGSGVLVGLLTVGLRIAHWMPPFGYRPLLYLVVLLETLGFLLFGFGIVAEMIAQQQTELDWMRRRLDRRDGESRTT